LADSLDLKLDQLFTEEMELLDKEMEDLDGLYKDTRVHYDRLLASKSMSTLQFVQQQASNIISMKSNKMSLIKEKASLKRNLAELAIKEFNTNFKASGGGEGQDTQAILAGIYSMILNEKKDDLIAKTQEDVRGTAMNETMDYDSIMEERLKDIEKEENPEVEEDNKDEVKESTEHRYVVDMDKNIYCVDENYDLIEDAPIPNFVIEFVEVDGVIKAFNQFEEELEIIEAE